MPFSPFSLTATSHPTDISNDSNNIRSNSNNNALPHGTANDNNINAGSTINGDDDDGGSGPKGNTAAHSHFAAHSQFGPPPVVTHSRSAIAAATAVSGAAAAATGGSGSSTSGAPAGTAGAHSHDSRAAQPQHPLTSSAFAAYKQPNFSSAGGLSALSSGYLPVQAQKQSQVQSHSQLPVIGASQSQSPTTSTSVHNNSISNLTMSASTSSSITQANSTVSGFAVGKSSARNSLSHSTFNMNNNNTSMSNANNASARASANANTAAALAVTAASASVTATNKSALRALALPVLGLYFAYTLFALLQESLFLQPGFEYRYAFALTSVQYALYVILSAVRLWWHGRDADSNHSAAHSHSYDRKGDRGQNAYQYSSLSTTGADDGVSAANVSGLSANNTPRHNTSRMNGAGANDSAISLESISINTQANPMFDDNGYKNEAEGDDSSTDSATTDYDSHRNIFNNSNNDNNHDEHKTSGNVSRNHCYESQSGSRSRSRSQSRSHSHSRSRLFLLSPTAVTPLPTGGASPAVLAPLLHPYSSSLNLSTSPTHGHSPSSGDKNASTSAENDDNSPSSESDSDSITPAAWRFYLIGGLTFVSSALSNVGCHNLPYPLQVMLKSCKVLPTVVIGSLFFGSKYRRLELAAIGLLTAGAALAALDAIFSASSAKLAKHALPIASSPTGPDMGSTVGTMGTGSTGDNIINDTGSAVADAVSATVAMAIDGARAFYRQQRVDSASAAAAAATAAAGAAGVFKTTAVAAAEAAVEAVVSSSGNGVTVSSVTATAGLFAGLAAWLAANGVHLPTLIGVGAMLAALSTDAVVNNSLERLLAKHQVHPALVILRVKTAALCCAATALIFSGALPAFAAYVRLRPETMVKMVCFALCGWVGESCLMAIVAQWGAVVGTALASGRKMGTIAISMLVFPKKKGVAFVVGVCIVFAGVVMEIAAKAAGKSKAKKHSSQNHSHSRAGGYSQIKNVADDNDDNSRITPKAGCHLRNNGMSKEMLPLSSNNASNNYNNHSYSHNDTDQNAASNDDSSSRVVRSRSQSIAALLK